MIHSIHCAGYCGIGQPFDDTLCDCEKIDMTAGLPFQISIIPGPFLFVFLTHSHWVNKSSSWFRNSGVRADETICVDAKGRLCLTGKQFARAEADGSFPIQVFKAVTE